MKKLILLFISALLAINIQSQVYCFGMAEPQEFNFDGGLPWEYFLQFDTLSNPDNIWQIGSPQKVLINEAYSLPNVIITDTENPYPVNDTSSFIVKHAEMGGISYTWANELAGYYYVNSDSLHDYGTIEISLDQGITWINLITDSIYSSYYQWLTPKPILTGNSYGWQNFWVSLQDLGYVFNVNPGDTIFFKFSFISDSIQNSFDGLAFDNIQFCDVFEGIPEIQNNDLIVIYPNPVNHLLSIQRTTNSSLENIEIFNQSGQLLFKIENFDSGYLDIENMKLRDGLYFLKYSNSTEFSFIKFLVCH
jgi:hypothetical protein